MENNAQNTKTFAPAKLLPFAVIAVLPLLFWQTFAGLASEWSQWDQSLSHAYPLLLWFAYLLFKASPLAIHRQHIAVDILLVIALIGLSLAWFLFQLVQIKLFEQLILLPLLYLSIAWVFGLKTFWQQRFLLLLPIFTLPVWDYLTTPLVELASLVVGVMVRWMQIPALIDGSSIFIPSGHIMIADGCSGLRYLIISLAMGHAISYLNGYREKGVIVCLILAGVLGLVANWIRIFGLILVGYYTEMQSSLMSDHETFGWVIFALVCFPAIYFAPVIRRVAHTSVLTPSVVGWKKLAVLILLLIPGVILAFIINPTAGTKPPAYKLDADYFHQSYHPMPVQMELPPSKIHHSYQVDSARLRIDQYYPETRKERLVPYIAHQFDTEAWVIDSSKIMAAKNNQVRIDILRQKSGVRKVVQLQWFDVGGYRAPTVPKAKLLQIPALLSGNNYFSIITLQTECANNSCDDAIQQLLGINELIIN